MAVDNLLLSVLPSEVVERLSRYSRTMDLEQSIILHRPGETIEEVYFPLTCLISVTVTMQDGRTSEAGIVGSREMVGVNAFMGGSETNQTEYIVQVGGKAVRMAAEPLLDEFNSNQAVRDVLLRYTQAYLAQISQNVACNRLHELKPRLARWLLECRDRAHSDELRITHEFLSQMLSVRRAGVTEGLNELQEDGFINCGRKSVQLINPRGLESTTCECFGVIRSEYDRLLEPMRDDETRPGHSADKQRKAHLN
jgi:CRP-like cAMP-binding protein